MSTSTDPDRAQLGDSTRPPQVVKSGFVAAHRRAFLLFVVVGCVNSLISYLIYIAALLVLPYSIAYTIAYGAGIFTSYAMNATFVFKRELRLSTALQYPLSYLIQYLAGLGLLHLLITDLGVSKYLAPLLVAVLLIPVGYATSRFLINR